MTKMFYMFDPCEVNRKYEVEDFCIRFIFSNPSKLDWPAFYYIKEEAEINERVIQAFPPDSLQEYLLRMMIEHEYKEKNLHLSYIDLIKTISTFIEVAK